MMAISFTRDLRACVSTMPRICPAAVPNDSYRYRTLRGIVPVDEVGIQRVDAELCSASSSTLLRAADSRMPVIP